MSYFNNNNRGSSGGGRGGNRFGGRDSGRREMHDAICDDCGNKCKLPFRPSGDKPVFCSDCFENHDSGRERRSDGGRSGGGRFGGGNNFDRDRRNDRRDSGRPQMHGATCDECGDRCEVPFKPSGDKPIYCDECFGNKGGNDRRDSNRSHGDRNRRDNYRGGDRKGRDDLKPLRDQITSMNGKIDTILRLLDPKAFKKADAKKDKAEKTSSKKTKVETKKKSVEKKATKKNEVKKKPSTKKAPAKKANTKKTAAKKKPAKRKPAKKAKK